MRLPENVAAVLIDRQAYRVCRLLPTYQFLRFCRERRMQISAERLRKLERLGLFMPILRIWRPDDIRKVEYIDGGRRYRDFGSLQPGEAWAGETRTELGNFGFNVEVVQSWWEHGFAWDPRATRSPYIASRETESDRHEAYYSRFQIDHLSHLLQMLTLRVEMEWALEDDGTTPSASGADRQAWMVERVRHAVERRNEIGYLDKLGPLCQLISDRYYPKTQSDERRFKLSTGYIEFGEWDWYEYARNWDARAAVDYFDLTPEWLRRAYEALSIKQSYTDPIAAWHPLVRFISMEKRERLKGDALMAMSLREMALMLRMLHRDAFGELTGC